MVYWNRSIKRVYWKNKVNNKIQYEMPENISDKKKHGI